METVNSSMIRWMLFLVITFSWCSVATSPLSRQLVSQPGIRLLEIKGKQGRVADVPSKHYHRITASPRQGRGKTNSRSAAAVIGAVQRMHDGGAYENVTSETAFGTVYAVQLLWGQTPLSLVLDTGSSDTWVVQSNFTCLSQLGDKIDQSGCWFGPTYNGTFSGGSIFDQNLFTQYGDLETAAGPMGYQDITIANITVHRQEVALVNETYWQGDNITSGIMGLAYPSITNDYFGSNPAHGWLDEMQYPPIFTSMIQQGLSEPYFAIALERNSSGGVISFGGPPPVPDVDYSDAAEAPIIVTNLNKNPYTSWEYSFYTVIPDGFAYNQVTDTTRYPVVIDSGTTLIYLPKELAEAVNGAYQPAATYFFEYNAYFTTCTAIVPFFEVLLGGKRFPINPQDMLYRNVRDPLTGLCMTAINNGGTGPFILGDAFMQNVVTIVDVGNSTMRFVSRPFY